MSSKAKRPLTNEDAGSALAPKLRFPEFRAAPWKLVPLKELADRGKTKNRDEKIERVLTNSAEFGVVDQRDFFDKDIAIQGKLDSYVVVELGDYVYNPRISATAPVGPISRNNIGTGVMSPLYTVFRFKSSENGFYQHYFKTTGWHSYMRQASSTGARHDRMAIGSDDFMAMPLPVAKSPAEEQKISDCLSSVDVLLAAQARKVDALKTHKQGLMRQLFPRDGETQPHLRFSEFQNSGHWAKVALGDIAEIKLGKMLDKQKHTTGNFLPYLNNLAVRWNAVSTSDLPKMYFSDRELDRFGLRAGDVVVCEGGEPGRAAVWDGRLPDLKFQKAIHRVRFKVPFEPKLLVLYLENIAGTTDFEMLFTGGGIKHLTGETFSKLKVPLIPHAEQQRIASCLSSLDALIAAENQKLEALKIHKKGLMQQLFPSQEEVEA
jgi:type I restriction enzyme, S subunit